jgi:hypothetical protein
MAARTAKCPRPACECVVSSDGPFGKYCCEECRELGQVTELHCTCRHDECRHPERHISPSAPGA